MTPEMRGAFWDLIFRAWLEPDGMLPNDETVLAAYSGLGGDRWAAVGRTVVQLAFKRKGERLFNRRLMKERQLAIRKSKLAQKAGWRSGETRAKRKKKAQ